jgi:hypothetical protein
VSHLRRVRKADLILNALRAKKSRPIIHNYKSLNPFLENVAAQRI